MARARRLESGWTRRSQEVGAATRPEDGPMVCRAVFDELCVLANGDIVCSCADPAGRRVYGNVHRDRIAEVFGGPRYRGMRRAQLAAAPSSWCPVAQGDCPLRVWRATASDGENGRAVRLLQLEPISRCNLSCPECPVSHFEADDSYRPDRAAMLPLAVMLDVLDQLPELEKILFFNYGEPFLHPHAIEFLRQVRTRRPGVKVDVSTNGLAFTPAKLEAIAAEALVDQLVFSIDGAREETYARYRVGGRLGRALEALAGAVAACRRHGTSDRLEVVWQYILFEWNDSDAEIAEARRRATELGVRIKWVITHTAGASRRYPAGDPAALSRLEASDPWRLLSCNQRQENLWDSGSAWNLRYRAGLEPEQERVEARPGARFALRLRIGNRSASSWDGPEAARLRLGVRLRTPNGRVLRELPSLPLPAALLPPNGAATTLYDGFAPDEPGEYELFFDLVEEGVAWFHERGSRAAVCRLRVTGEREGWCGAPLADAALA
ncbi:MAG: radical SAM protein, partial [Thermoanaerobaculia bacterium]